LVSHLDWLTGVVQVEASEFDLIGLGRHAPVFGVTAVWVALALPNLMRELPDTLVAVRGHGWPPRLFCRIWKGR
jgi:hypothetical protein